MSRIVFIIAFFAYGGYYAGLAIIFALNLGEISRFYSQPLRVLMAILMLYVIHKNRFNLVFHKLSFFISLFIFFWIIYSLKVLYTITEFSSGTLSRPWYEYILYSIIYVVIPFICYCSLDIRRYWLNIISGFIYSGFILGIVSIYLYGEYLISGVGRINAISYETGEAVLNPLAMSYTGVLTILLCIFKLVIYKKNSKIEVIFLISTIFISLVLFLYGASRGSVVVLVTTLPLFIIFGPSKQKMKILLSSFIISPLLVWLVNASGSGLFTRLSKTTEDQGGGRTTLWRNAINHFFDNQLIGGRIEIGNIYPHNFIVEILMATGMLGAILIFPVLLKGFLLGIKQSKSNKEHLYALIILMVGLVHYSFSGGLYTTILLFIPVGIIFSLQNYNENNSEKQQ
ncbi:O-antigen ligase family protein [Arenibacter amylolyticus]|uniref:O-antigen ligase family protein n=1 Tax=Arenibacter amylolyticus TaxID=1406873 RepID=UPI000A360DD4|nr:O-antigen ligase family protein [Arenibacter amylolyticus]